jgi:hypothetical protein
MMIFFGMSLVRVRAHFPSPLRGGVGVGVVRLGESIGETGAVSAYALFVEAAEL